MRATADAFDRRERDCGRDCRPASNRTDPAAAPPGQRAAAGNDPRPQRVLRRPARRDWLRGRARRRRNGCRTIARRRPTRPNDATLSNARTLVVDASPGLPAVSGELVVSDLAEACRIALQNSTLSTIEVRQNGRLDMPPLVLRLDDRQLKITAAEGYAPILSFRTGTSVSDFDSEGMIQASGGSLEFDGIHLEMIVPNETLDGEWSLFQLADACRLRIRRGTLTVHNSYGGRFSNLDNVAIFNCILPDRDDMLAPDMGQPRDAIEVQLTDCVIRCEATVLRAREAIPIRFQWTNGLLVTSERLASLGGAGQIPRDGERMELTLQQVTAVVDQGLVELSSSLRARPSCRS